MIRLGIVQLIAGILLVLSGVYNILHREFVGFPTVAFGLYVIWTSVQRIDPPLGV